MGKYLMRKSPVSEKDQNEEKRHLQLHMSFQIRDIRSKDSSGPLEDNGLTGPGTWLRPGAVQ